MLKLSLFVVLAVSFTSTAGAVDPDTAWCNIQAKGEKPLTYDFTHQVYQAFYERTGGRIVGNGSEEVREFYDGEKNIAIAKQAVAGVKTTSFLYGKKNELLLVKPNDFGLNECTALPLSEFWPETPFYLYPIGNETHIISPMNYLLKMGAKLTYTGPSEIRGIPANNWQYCLYNTNNDVQSTQLMTLSISDGDKWVPAENSNYKSIPIEFTVKTKQTDKFSEYSETYTVTEFKPYLLLQEEDYFPSAGTYCENRINIQEFPKLPTEMAFYLEGALSATTNGLDGILTKTKEFYDFDAKLFKMNFFKDQRPITEVHDFRTGLVYSVDDQTGNCSVTQINPDGIDAVTGPDGFTNIRNPEQFFDTQNVTYQFSGSRRVNGVNTLNWIGKQKFKIIIEADTLFEWSFLYLYNRTDDVNKFAPTPVRLVMTQLIPIPVGPNQIVENIPVPYVYNFVDFRVSDSLGAHHDIRQCVQASESKTFSVSFDVSDEVILLAKAYPNVFKKAAYRGLHKAAKVTMIRIQNLQILYKDNHIFFVFEIMEKSRFYGNVMVPFDDVSLEDAEFHLGDNVAKSNLKVNFVVGDIYNNQDFLLVGNPLSYARIENQNDGFTQITTVVRPNGYTGVTVAVACVLVATTLLVVVFGILVLHKNRKFTLPFLPIN